MILMTQVYIHTKFKTICNTLMEGGFQYNVKMVVHVTCNRTYDYSVTIITKNLKIQLE